MSVLNGGIILVSVNLKVPVDINSKVPLNTLK